MDRRNARLRREYLYKKSLEVSEAEDFEKRKRLKEALEEGRVIPTDLRQKASSIKTDLEHDDPDIQTLKTHIDDEYQKVGVYDPKILLTTSADPSSRLMQFAKELRICFPNCQRINRGRTDIADIVNICRQNDFTDLVMVHEQNGEPNGLVVSHFPYGPTAYFTITGCVLRHDLNADIGTMSEAFPHLIFENFSSKLGERTKTILQSLFPVPRDTTRRVMSFINRNDTISYRHHMYKRNGTKEKAEGKSDIELAEVGPRFELKIYQIKLGTVDMKEAELEWVLKSFMNSSKKRKLL